MADDTDTQQICNVLACDITKPLETGIVKPLIYYYPYPSQGTSAGAQDTAPSWRGSEASPPTPLQEADAAGRTAVN